MREIIVRIHPEAIKALVNKSWLFAYDNCWKKFLLSELEVYQIRGIIHKYYWSIPPEEFTDKANQYFERFCERVLQEAKTQSSEIINLLNKQIAEVS